MHVSYDLSIDQLPRECIDDCGKGPGAKDAAVDHWLKELSFTVDRDRAVDCLAGYGAWTREEMADEDDATIAGRILWLACSTFAEYDPEDDRCGSDIFVLE